VPRVEPASSRVEVGLLTPYRDCCTTMHTTHCTVSLILLTYLFTGAHAVLTPTDGSCYVSSESNARTPLISSLLTTDTTCGSPQTPWIVEVQPGQQINFTLIDFTSSSNASQHSSRCDISGACSSTCPDLLRV